MKITRSNNNLKKFRDLSNGDVFELTYDDGGCKMKIEETKDEHGYINAVYLEDGTLTYIGGEEEVIPIDCELIIN